MSEKTSIEYADTSLNPMMGCAGCELWSGTGTAGPRVRVCYAGKLTSVYGGRRGWPDTFERPKIFPERFDQIERLTDLTGSERILRPWLSGLPRVIFLCDMGDAFTRGLPDDWLAPYLPRIAAAPHIFLLLTKLPSRMAEFSARHPLPPNVWPGVSVTTHRTFPRIETLRRRVVGGGPRWVSWSPMWEAPGNLFLRALMDDRRVGPQAPIEWVVLEGESGNRDGAPVPELGWFVSAIGDARQAGAAAFVKQLGTSIAIKIGLSDAHGRKMEEWPEFVRVREMPTPRQGLGQQQIFESAVSA